LILLSVAFNGIIKSQGAKVKLMLCKKTQSKMNKKSLETNFYKKCKTSNFSRRKTSFPFEITKILCSKYEGFSLRSASYLYLTCIAKTYAKQTSFLATDATTQSSNQEENDTNFLFYFIAKQRNKEK
jgi:hypothetical protein